MIRLDEKQYRAVKKMTRAACANNDCGNCLLLDDGETCVCVQSISSTFAAGSNRAKYCPDCAAKIRRRQKAQSERNRRLRIKTTT